MLGTRGRTRTGPRLLALLAALATAAVAVPAADADGGHRHDARQEAMTEQELAAELDLPGDWSTTTGWQPDEEAVRLYAEDNGLDPSQALEVLRFQERTSMLLEDLRRTLAPVLSMLSYVRDEPVLEIHVVGNGIGVAATAAEILGPDADGARVVPGAAMTLLEWAAAEELGQSVDRVTGRPVPPAAPATMLSDSCQHRTGGVSEGGRAITHRDGSASNDVLGRNHNGYTDCVPLTNDPHLCTTGVAATRGSYQGYVTAGHCVHGQDGGDYWTTMYAYDMTRPYAHHRFNRVVLEKMGDAGFVRERFGSTAISSNVYIDEENGFRRLRDHLPGAPGHDAFVCGKGAANAFYGYGGFARNDDTAGYFCGYVTETHHAHPSFGATGRTDHSRWAFAQMEIAHAYVTRNRVIIGGDSGGTMFSGSTLYGIMTSGADCVMQCNGRPGYRKVNFMHANEIEDELGVTLNVG